MKTLTGSEVTVQRFDSVGPSIGKQVASRAALAVGVAALAVVIYIMIAFQKVENAFRYGVCAVIAMMHDVAVVFAVAGDRQHVLRLANGFPLPDRIAHRDRFFGAG